MKQTLLALITFILVVVTAAFITSCAPPVEPVQKTTSSALHVIRIIKPRYSKTIIEGHEYLLIGDRVVHNYNCPSQDHPRFY